MASSGSAAAKSPARPTLPSASGKCILRRHQKPSGCATLLWCHLPVYVRDFVAFAPKRMGRGFIPETRSGTSLAQSDRATFTLDTRHGRRIGHRQIGAIIARINYPPFGGVTCDGGASRQDARRDNQICCFHLRAPGCGHSHPSLFNGTTQQWVRCARQG